MTAPVLVAADPATVDHAPARRSGARLRVLAAVMPRGRFRPRSPTAHRGAASYAACNVEPPATRSPASTKRTHTVPNVEDGPAGAGRIDVAVARLARRQAGVVAREQLLSLGLLGRAIAGRVEAGRLHALHGGVYAVGHAAVTWEGRARAALLAATRIAQLLTRRTTSNRPVTERPPRR